MKVEKFEDLVSQFSQHGSVVPPQFRTNALSQSLNGSIIAITNTKGDSKVYVGVKYPQSFVKKIQDVHESKVVGRVDDNMNLIKY